MSFFYLSHHILNIFTKDNLWRSYCFPLITVVAGTPGSASLYYPPIDNGSENPWRVGLPPSGIFNEHVWNLNPIIFFPFCPSTWVQIRYFCILWVFHIILHKRHLNTIVTFHCVDNCTVLLRNRVLIPVNLIRRLFVLGFHSNQTCLLSMEVSTWFSGVCRCLRLRWQALPKTGSA